MLTDQDIDKIIDRFTPIMATKQDVAKLTSDFTDAKELLQGLITSVDKLAKSVDDMLLEYAAIKTQVDRHEKWLLEIAKKLDVKLEY
jgi:predicted  nucleic acid-binding Zn-ribbon protein